ncbi:hypothetical protein N5K35_01400 [Pseudomonas sp. GD03651]|uniref:hypothetical protein n=1 Tax=unclassified Pseudomonas TaxID=196821 RepID=UPI00244A735E|nr:hypothetical protein [Pseudomonas sp. GD03651]MDH2182382.1 hypothetical protein [Pseudomonas sp. GD03651]
MNYQASLIAGRTTLGRHLIRAAVRTGRVANQLEIRILRSSLLAFVPFQYRKVGIHIIKLVLVLAVASVALFLAIGMIAIWALAALPISESCDDEPGVHEVSHPQHQHKYPELYDEFGSLR